MQNRNVLFITFSVMLLVFSSNVWSGNSINGLRFWDSPQGTRIVIDLKKAPKYDTFRLENPHRIIIDLNNTKLKGKIPYIKRSHALIKNLRTAARKNRAQRLVIDTKEKTKYRSYALLPNATYGHRLVIELNDESPMPVAMAKLSQKKPARSEGQLRDIIVAIDAGHGGEDPGAIGKRGTQEKHIALSIAKKLKKLIDKQKGMRAVLVRKGDYYISLRNRMEIARNARADMFISIHADAFRNRNVKGSSVFVLSEKGASDENAKWIADKENAADLIGGVSLDDKDTILAKVLLDLSQTATIEASTHVAKNVLSEIGKIGPVHKNSVQSARFVVLKSPDIPSLLVETAFISNPSEERRLKDDLYQRKLAKAIIKGVKAYFKKSPPPNTRLARQRDRDLANKNVSTADFDNRLNHPVSRQVKESESRI